MSNITISSNELGKILNTVRIVVDACNVLLEYSGDTVDYKYGYQARPVGETELSALCESIEALAELTINVDAYKDIYP